MPATRMVERWARCRRAPVVKNGHKVTQFQKRLGEMPKDVSDAASGRRCLHEKIIVVEGEVARHIATLAPRSENSQR